MMRADPRLLDQAGSNHDLSAQLLAFHAELARVKQDLLAPADGAAAEMRRPAAVARVLSGFLQAQEVALQGLGGRHALDNQADARYLKVALADEALIGLEQWEYHDEWLSELLEMRLFGSRCAGERVFSTIDTLLREDVPARRAMARLYLLALAMDFQGRHRGSAAGAQYLRHLRTRLYGHAGGAPVLPAPDDGRRLADPDLRRRLLPQAYDYTIIDAAPRMLPDPRRWIWLFGAAAVALLLAANWIWHARTDTLSDYFDNKGMTARSPAPAPGTAGKTP